MTIRHVLKNYCSKEKIHHYGIDMPQINPYVVLVGRKAMKKFVELQIRIL